MEEDSIENTEISSFSSSDVDHLLEKLIPLLSNHRDVEPKHEITVEVRGILEAIATTGKYWVTVKAASEFVQSPLKGSFITHDWDMLKNLLSFRLKQVLTEYPESQMLRDVGPQQNPFFLETYPELVKRLDEALLSFIDGPPFTLRRLCEMISSSNYSFGRF